VLTTDLVSAGGDCLVVEADAVTLDCAGHSVTGAGAGRGVLVADRNNVTVKNCTVSNFDTGIFITGGADHKLLSNRSVDNSANGGGIQIGFSDATTLDSNTVSRNLNVGIYVLFGTHTLVSNRAEDTRLGAFGGFQGEGIRLDANVGSTLRANTSTGNHTGFLIFQGSDNLLDSNVAENNLREPIGLGAGDIFAIFSHRNRLVTNIARANAFGVHLGGNENLLDGNLVEGNEFHGIVIASGDGHTVVNNQISNHPDTGVAVSRSTGAVLRSNTVTGNSTGFFLHTEVTNTLISSNTLNNSLSSGIRLEGIAGGLSDVTFNTITSNRITANPFSTGILLIRAPDNTIFNNFLNDGQWVGLTEPGANEWNVPQAPGPNIAGGLLLGGNFYGRSDGAGYSQTCADANTDRVADVSATASRACSELTRYSLTAPTDSDTPESWTCGNAANRAEIAWIRSSHSDRSNSSAAGGSW